MRPASSRLSRLRDLVLLVGASSGATLGVLMLVVKIAQGQGTLVDSVLRERGLPSSAGLAGLLLSVAVICGIAYVWTGGRDRGSS